MDVELPQLVAEEILGAAVRDGAVAEADPGEARVAEHGDQRVPQVAVQLARRLEQLLPDLVRQTQRAQVHCVRPLDARHVEQVGRAEPGRQLQQRVRAVVTHRGGAHLSCTQLVNRVSHESIILMHYYVDPSLL